MSIMKLLQSILVIICLTSCLAAVPRVREKGDFPRQFDIGDVVDTIPSASSIVKSLDDISLSLVNRFSSTVSSLTPVLTVTALTYFAYVASVLFFPGALSRMGIPVLEEMSAKSSNVPRPTPKFIDSLANDFVKDLFGKSNAAEAMKQTAREVVADSVFVVRTVTKMVSTELKKAQKTVRDLSDALSPGCIARYMCRAGQFTSVHLPTLGAVLRNFRARFIQWCEQDASVCTKFNNETAEKYRQRLRRRYEMMGTNERITLGHQLEKFIIYAEYERNRYEDALAQFYDYEYTNCFTFNSLWGTPDIKIEEATLFNPVTGKSSELILCMNVESNNYSPLDDTVRIRMVIHSADTVPNPRYDGVSLQTGMFYSYGVREVTVYLLEAPYQTNCRNYSEEKETRTGGKMNQENCLVECFKNETQSQCGCSYHRLALLYSGRICETEEEKNCLNYANEKIKMICYRECRMPCKKVTYDYVAVDSEPLRGASGLYQAMNASQIFKDFNDMRENMTCVKIYYGSTDSTTMTHRPKYEFVEVFSLIGGYSGLWLGFSLLAGFSYITSRLQNLKIRVSPTNYKNNSHNSHQLTDNIHQSSESERRISYERKIKFYTWTISTFGSKNSGPRQTSHRVN